MTGGARREAGRSLAANLVSVAIATTVLTIWRGPNGLKVGLIMALGLIIWSALRWPKAYEPSKAEAERLRAEFKASDMQFSPEFFRAFGPQHFDRRSHDEPDQMERRRLEHHEREVRRLQRELEKAYRQAAASDARGVYRQAASYRAHAAVIESQLRRLGA